MSTVHGVIHSLRVRIPPRVLHFSAFINHRRACARVTVVCVCVCVCVCFRGPSGYSILLYLRPMTPMGFS